MFDISSIIEEFGPAYGALIVVACYGIFHLLRKPSVSLSKAKEHEEQKDNIGTVLNDVHQKITIHAADVKSDHEKMLLELHQHSETLRFIERIVNKGV